MSYINDVLYVVPGCIHLFNDASVRLKSSLEGPRKSVPPALTALTSWVHTQGNLPRRLGRHCVGCDPCAHRDILSCLLEPGRLDLRLLLQ